jgi:hypothetical protein
MLGVKWNRSFVEEHFTLDSVMLVYDKGLRGHISPHGAVVPVFEEILQD